MVLLQAAQLVQICSTHQLTVCISWTPLCTASCTEQNYTGTDLDQPPVQSARMCMYVMHRFTGVQMSHRPLWVCSVPSLLQAWPCQTRTWGQTDPCPLHSHKRTAPHLVKLGLREVRTALTTISDDACYMA